MTCFERDIRMKEQNFDVKLQSTEDAHRNAMMELRQMLAAQQRMSAKYGHLHPCCLYFSCFNWLNGTQ